jgi:hypothetical protein
MAASGVPMRVPSRQSHARPLSLIAQLQLLPTSAAQHHLALLILSWQMQSSALPLKLRPTPPLCGASSLGRGSPPTCHATLGGTPQHLQALIDALVAYCATLHMEISVTKTKVMVVSKPSARSPAPPTPIFTCNGLPVGRVDTFKYLGLHFHASGDISHIITPLKAKAAGSWAVVQQRHSQLQCGNAVNLEAQTLPVTKHPGTVSALRL